MASKTRKHSGRKRPTGELKKLNLRKFEKMVALAGDRGLDVIPHIDPRYYPTIVPHKPIQATAGAHLKKNNSRGSSPQDQWENDQDRKAAL